jgi:hypothetical protein
MDQMAGQRMVTSAEWKVTGSRIDQLVLTHWYSKPHGCIMQGWLQTANGHIGLHGLLRCSLLRQRCWLGHGHVVRVDQNVVGCMCDDVMMWDDGGHCTLAYAHA